MSGPTLKSCDPTTAFNLTEQQWDEQRPLIEQLYRQNTLNGTLAALHERGFSITRRTLRRRLDTWRIFKNKHQQRRRIVTEGQRNDTRHDPNALSSFGPDFGGPSPAAASQGGSARAGFAIDHLDLLPPSITPTAHPTRSTGNETTVDNIVGSSSDVLAENQMLHGALRDPLLDGSLTSHWSALFAEDELDGGTMRAYQWLPSTLGWSDIELRPGSLHSSLTSIVPTTSTPMESNCLSPGLLPQADNTNDAVKDCVKVPQQQHDWSSAFTEDIDVETILPPLRCLHDFILKAEKKYPYMLKRRISSSGNVFSGLNFQSLREKLDALMLYTLETSKNAYRRKCDFNFNDANIGNENSHESTCVPIYETNFNSSGKYVCHFSGGQLGIYRRIRRTRTGKKPTHFEYLLTLEWHPPIPGLLPALSVTFEIFPERQSSVPLLLRTFNIVPEDSAIVKFVKKGNIGAVRKLFTRKAASARDVLPGGYSLLSYALEPKSFEMFQLLLDHGAGLENCNLFNCSIDLIWALWYGYHDDMIPHGQPLEHSIRLTNMALKRGCDSETSAPYHPEVPSPLFRLRLMSEMDYGIENSQKDINVIVGNFLEIGWQIDSRTPGGETPLLQVSESLGALALRHIKALMKHGADVNKQDSAGEGILHHILSPDFPFSTEIHCSIRRHILTNRLIWTVFAERPLHMIKDPLRLALAFYSDDYIIGDLEPRREIDADLYRPILIGTGGLGTCDHCHQISIKEPDEYIHTKHDCTLSHVCDTCVARRSEIALRKACGLDDLGNSSTSEIGSDEVDCGSMDDQSTGDESREDSCTDDGCSVSSTQSCLSMHAIRLDMVSESRLKSAVPIEMPCPLCAWEDLFNSDEADDEGACCPGRYVWMVRVFRARTKLKLLFALHEGANPNVLNMDSESPSHYAKVNGLEEEWNWALQWAGYVFDENEGLWVKPSFFEDGLEANMDLSD